MRGEIDESEYAREIALVRDKIGGLDAPHWRSFRDAWDRASAPGEGVVSGCPAV